MRRLPILTVAILSLAACHQSGPNVSVTNATEGEIRAKLANSPGAAAMISPGRWEGSVTVTDMRMPKLPPAQQAKLAGAFGKPEPIVSCLTQADVDARRGFFTGTASDDKSCKYDHFTMADGVIDAQMSCARDDAKSSMTLKGSYGADAYHLAMTMNVAGDSPYSTMTTSSTVDAKRVGECRGDEEKSERHH